VTEVLNAIRGACKRWNVREVAADTSRWVAELEGLAEEGVRVVDFPQSRSRMIPATDRAAAGVMEKTLSHSGDPVLARHVMNAIRRPDGQLSKVSKHSPRKIDATVAMVMALDRAATYGSQSVGIWSTAELAEKLIREGRIQPPAGFPSWGRQISGNWMVGGHAPIDTPSPIFFNPNQGGDT
jgi:phage terminase large subunit-like protein